MYSDMKTENIKLSICEGDCLDVLRGIAADSIDLIVTSPPYANQRKKVYGGVSPKNYSKWFLPRAEEMKRVLKPSGSFILNIWEHCEKGQRHPYVYRLVLNMIDSGWLWIEEYIWHKLNPLPGKHKLRVRDAWEHLYHFAKTTDLSIYQSEVDIPAKWQLSDKLRERKRWGVNNKSGLSGGKRRVRGNGSGFGTNDYEGFDFESATAHNVIESIVGGESKTHPGTFPKAIPEFFIKLFTRPYDTVLDPFAGSGTTIFTAYAMDRHSIGIDKMPEYVTYMQNKKAQLKAQLKLPLNWGDFSDARR